MKIVYLFILLTVSAFVFSEESPEIILPEITIELEDSGIWLKSSEIILQDSLSIIKIKPELTDKTLFQLKELLPDKIELIDSKKIIDAEATVGYGFNQNFFLDVNLYLKNLNPNFSIKYQRSTMENKWIDDYQKKSTDSKDFLLSNFIFQVRNFILNADFSMLIRELDLQNQSIFQAHSYKIFDLNINPIFRFTNNNSISVVLNQSLLTDDYNNKISNSNGGIYYSVNGSVIYNQTIAKNHDINVKGNYQFQYHRNQIQSLALNEISQVFYNNFNFNADYSTLLFDSLIIQSRVNFYGYFRNYEFFWFINPYLNIGYHYKNWINLNLDGGSELQEKPDYKMVNSVEYTLYPYQAISSYQWFAQFQINGNIMNWMSLNGKVRFNYTPGYFDWSASNTQENLYTLNTRSTYELLINPGIRLYYQPYLDFEFQWLHQFLDRKYYTGSDIFKSRFSLNFEKVGIKTYLEFYSELFRKDQNQNDLENLFLLNWGFDWSWKNYFGLGVELKNMIYYQKYQLKPGYDEPGFTGIFYIKAGF